MQMNPDQIPIISIVGWHNVGKTSFVTRLIVELKRRGLRVATIKHTRGDFQLDHEGTDTWRYAQAGSDLIAISGHGRLAVLEQALQEPEGELRLADIVARLPSHLDIVVTEGFKEATTPKIEIVSSCAETRRVSGAGELLAQVVGLAQVDQEGGTPRHGATRAKDDGGGPVPPGTPCFRMDEVEAIVDLLAARGVVRTP
jgi:molybdopterin-guanine dinucleotide biosynthesis adapter protein